MRSSFNRGVAKIEFKENYNKQIEKHKHSWVHLKGENLTKFSNHLVYLHSNNLKLKSLRKEKALRAMNNLG